MALIELHDVHKTYEMGSEVVRALDGVSLEVEPGEYLAIMGPSGSGKSTLMNVVGCLDRPSSGTYVLNGEPVQDFDDQEMAAVRNREIGFVFQTFNLLSRTDALHNVELPLIYSGLARKERRQQAERALEQVGLADRMHHQPSELSGGQRQRVAIARALVNNPSILLADEPTGNLDTQMADSVMELLAEINANGTTIIMVTHELTLANRAKRNIFVRDGHISDGPPELHFATAANA